MADRNKVATTCRVSHAFSSERRFAFVLANGEEYCSSAPVHFFWNQRGQPLGENEPEEEAEGKLDTSRWTRHACEPRERGCGGRLSR